MGYFPAGMPSVLWSLNWFFFFSGRFRSDDWLSGRMASCQHLQSPALSGRSRQLVESSSRPATVLEDQGESLEWSLMLLMEVCGSKYALPDFFSSCIIVFYDGKWAKWRGLSSENLVRGPRWCDPKELTYGPSDAQGWSIDLLYASAKWKAG